MTINSRTKGHSYERTVAKQFAEVMPGADIKRGLGQCRAGSDVPDVVTPWFWVECKRGKKTNIKAALRQAEAACGDRPLYCIAVTRDDRDDAMVTMRFDDFLEIVRDLWELKTR